MLTRPAPRSTPATPSQHPPGSACRAPHEPTRAAHAPPRAGSSRGAQPAASQARASCSGARSCVRVVLSLVDRRLQLAAHLPKLSPRIRLPRGIDNDPPLSLLSVERVRKPQVARLDLALNLDAIAEQL